MSNILSRFTNKIKAKLPGEHDYSNNDVKSAHSASSSQAGTPTARSSTDNGSRRQSRDIERARRKKQLQVELKQHKEEEEQAALRDDTSEMRARYGKLPINQSTERNFAERFELAKLNEEFIGKEITFEARIHTNRQLSAHLTFIVFRQQTYTVQGVLKEQENVRSKHFLYWAEHLPDESIMLVKAKVRKAEQEVSATTIHDLELDILELHQVSTVTEPPAFSVYDADITNGEIERQVDRRKGINDRTRLANRIVDLRTPTMQSVFRITHGVCLIFRSTLSDMDFIEIHTPKLQGGATESGSSVFQLDYFGRSAFLAQSPQLAKQMCIAADFGRVFEVGPVFRAENSNTHRHLTEYTGLDLEMSLKEHYHECLETLDVMFKATWKGIYQKYRKEIDLVKRQFPHEDLVWLDKTPIIPFAEGIRMLQDSGYKDENGKMPQPDEDLSTRAEIRLGELVKEHFKTDYYVLDKFPISARPFYAMPDPQDPKVTNSFDIFLRGQEILSGGQRIHDANMLEKQMKDLHMQQEGMEDYLDGFRWGAPPHAGGGIGLERLVMLLLNLGDIRQASMYPRDPQSFKAKVPPTDLLRHPEASTLHPPWEQSLENGVYLQASEEEGDNQVQSKRKFQPLEKLIANYGDATNTSGLEARMHIWRCFETGAAIAWAPTTEHGDHACVLGNPLCEKSQYTAVITAFLKYLKKEHNLKPIWVLCDFETQEILGTKLGWKTFTCCGEQRVKLTDQAAENRKELQKKQSHAKGEGVSIKDFGLGNEPSKSFQEKCRPLFDEWLKGRNDDQNIHISKMEASRIFRDFEHRWFFYATDKSDKICCLIVLAQLSIEHGYQVKYSVDFPGAPNGAIESITLHALSALKDMGVPNATFGAGAGQELKSTHNLEGVKVKLLQKSYKEIVSRMKTLSKSEFRMKFGAEQDPLWLAYPKGAMGATGIKALMDFFTADG